MGNCFTKEADDPASPDAAAAADSTSSSGPIDAAPIQNAPISTATCTSPPKPAAIGPVLGRPMEDVCATYSLGKELGRGQFGVTHLCTHKDTGEKLACKTIAKRKLANKEDIEDVRREVQIIDLKPENFLLLNKDEDAPLKATDFGLSVFFKQGEVFKDIVGSAYYIAPEVLKRAYGPEADIWSIGVMLYIFLCGVPPFWADHPWIKEDGEAPDTPLDNAVLNRLKQFRAMNQFKKAALRVIAGCLSEEEIRGLKEMFKNMDSDNSGTITLEELKQGLAKQGTKLSENITMEELEQALKEKGLYDEKEIKDIISEADVDNVSRK
ncbi:hypothetical protein GW17_00012416 [Ensete ventricosum]|nr:hypothetical protein GW17_00012416 [Ensete ventricosum]